MAISVFLAPDIGGKERKNMSKEIIYTDAPEQISQDLINGEVIRDFLPPPDQLVRKEPKVKITITLNRRSVDFYKQSAKKHNVKYQAMINEILDLYAQRYRHLD
jgi:predicted DNA binding CopG/RHH family protein